MVNTHGTAWVVLPHAVVVVALINPSYSHVVNGTNVLVKARTGTGKTLGFSLPIAGKLCATEAYVGNPSVRAGGAKLVLGVCR